MFAGASETNGTNNAKSSGGVEKRDTSNRSRGRSSSGRGGTGSLDVFIDRGVVNKVVGKLVSGILNKNSNNLNMPMLMMPFDFTELNLHGRNGISFDSLMFGLSEVWDMIEEHRLALLIDVVKNVRLGMKMNPEILEEEEEEEEEEEGK